MKIRPKLIAMSLTALAVAAISPAMATASGGGAVPQIAGTWNGQEHYITPAVFTRQLTVTFQEDTSGNLSGSWCQQVTFCSPLAGKIDSTGRMTIQFASDTTATKVIGTLRGKTTCSNGSIGRVISGTFKVRETTGTFSMNDCPVAP